MTYGCLAFEMRLLFFNAIIFKKILLKTSSSFFNHFNKLNKLYIKQADVLKAFHLVNFDDFPLTAHENAITKNIKKLSL